MSPLDVLCFGEALVDFFPEVPGLPLCDIERFVRHLGGAPANVSVGLARLGLRVGLMTQVGKDDFGTFLRRELAREGVDTTSVGVHASARTGITFVSVGPKGERSLMSYRPPSADQLVGPDDVQEGPIARARVFHYGSSTMATPRSKEGTRRALELAHAAGSIISSDPNLRLPIWPSAAEARAVVREVLGGTELVKLSEDEIEPLVGTRDVARAASAVRELGVGLCVVTLGERGCYFDGAAAGRGLVAGEPVEVVDTTGAGDGFVAGLLSALAPHFAQGLRPAALPSEHVLSACRVGNRAGSRVVTRLGATTALPHRADVADLMTR
jgi:fructokinase